MDSAKATKPGPAHAGNGALALVTIPYIFSQDDLLTSAEFLERAEKQGHQLSLDGLERLHNHRLLVPLYRVSDTPVEGRRLAATASPDNSNVRSSVLTAAAEGRLRDTAAEGYSAAWPYTKPTDEGRPWWNGFVFSSWQLLLLRRAVNRYEFSRHGFVQPDGRALADDRRLILALCALSTRYLPGVLGQLSLLPGDSETGLRRYLAAASTRDLLIRAGFDPRDLAATADILLAHAHDDPLQQWLPLIRHAGYRQGWSKLRGRSLENMWRRAAAEILLRTHEDLAAEEQLDPLPDLTGATWWSAQHDRLTPRHKDAKTLGRALAELGLSPYPKVLLLVEGETGLYHVPRLVSELGLRLPQDVRVQATKGSKVNPHLIARYSIAPRIGREIDKGRLLDASPTALLIAMDEENLFASQEKRDKMRKALQQCIREEVEYQDAAIGQDVLDLMVNIRVWGADTYELANFTDDELVPAITTLAQRSERSWADAPDWETRLRQELQVARTAHHDIKVPLQRLQVREDKIGLAQLLWPVLRIKCEAELAAGTPKTPVLQVVLEARDLAARFTGIFALDLPGKAPSAE
ncbi:hypothetical protein ACGFX4_38470 [Kitasatospora sp. NPDC048365]|uniref:hypothetical protein n=1 Tax=Kitasatospora sp. NPDC048365 TaxID=3364050 RepID=UPI003718036D